MSAQRVIAIDGPGGAGKSSISAAVADRLGLRKLDTGAIYRAVTYAVLLRGVDPADADAATAVAETVVVAFDDAGNVSADGVDVTSAIRDDSTTRNVSIVSAHSGVRRTLVAAQRRAVRGGRWVVEGRDIGAVVFPDAALKIYLTASVDVRPRRRISQTIEAGGDAETDPEIVRSDIERRDHADSTREDSPLTAAADAIVIDTSDMTFNEVVARVVDLWNARSATGDAGAASNAD